MLKLWIRDPQFEGFRDFEPGIHEIVGIYDIYTEEMVVSRMYTPTAAAHQFSSELGYVNSAAEEFVTLPSHFFPVRSRLLL